MNKFIVLILITLCAGTIHSEYKRADEFPIVSYKNIDVSDLNIQISSAAKKGENWAFKPFLVIQKYHDISDAKFVKITIENDRGEDSLKSIITLIEDGYMDDSLRGIWIQFYLERYSSAEGWKIKEIREAYLCGRMDSPKEFSKELCP